MFELDNTFMLQVATLANVIHLYIQILFWYSNTQYIRYANQIFV